MSDLKARIGPKVGRELFPNKTWVRPGLDINTTTPRPKWKNNKQVTTGYDSDQSSHEDMSATDRKPGFCRTSQSGTASLLTRMGLSPGGSEGDALEELEAQDVVKSLIERVQGTAANERGDLGAGHSNFHNAGFVTRISAAQDMNVKSLNNGEVNDNHQSPILETNLNAELAKTPSDNQLVGTTNNKEDKENLSNRRSHHLSSQNNGNDNVVDGPQGAKNLATGPSAGGGPDKNHFVPNFLDATHAHPVINPNSSSHPGLGEQTGMPRKHISHISTSASSGGSSGPEEGELSEPLPADKVRDLVLPLVLRNAADRTKDTEKETSSQPTPVDSNVLSDEVLSSFARRTRTIEGELHSHNVEPSTNISGSQAIASRAAGVAGAATASSSPTGGSSTAQISIRSDRPTPAPPITFAPQAAADIRQTSYPYPTTYSRYGPPLRYTPSPGSESGGARYADHRRPTNQEGPSSIADPRPEGRRSSSPAYHVRRRSSFSREDAYRRPYGRGYRSPERPRGPPPHSPRLPHSPPAARSTVLAEPMSRPSSSPTSHRPSSESGSSHRGGDPYPNAPSERARRASLHERDDNSHRLYLAHREGGDGRKRWRDSRPDDRYTRRSASPVPREPYKPYMSNQRRSRTPPRRGRPTSDPYYRDRSPRRRSSLYDRRPRFSERMDVSDDYGSGSIPSSNRSSNDVDGDSHHPYQKPEPQRAFAGNTPVNILGQETNERKPSFLPCHNVPGLWFASLGLDTLATLTCSFEVDQETAIKWNFHRSQDETSNNMPVASPPISQTKLSLQIGCFLKEAVHACIQSQQPGTSAHELALAVFSLENCWPTQGHLIVVVNSQNTKTKTWLPHNLGPTDPPISIANFVHEGQNIIQFIQLSGMSDKMFVLFAKENSGCDNHEDHAMIMQNGSEEPSTTGPITIKSGAVTISSR